MGAAGGIISSVTICTGTLIGVKHVIMCVILAPLVIVPLALVVRVCYERYTNK